MWIEFSLIVLGIILVALIAGYGEAKRILNSSLFSGIWHNYQWLERAGICVLSVVIGKNFDWGGIFVILALFGVLFFIIYDGMINIITYNRNFFYVSDTSKAFTEKFAHWWIKVPLLILVSIGNAILLNKFYTKEQ